MPQRHCKGRAYKLIKAKYQLACPTISFISLHDIVLCNILCVFRQHLIIVITMSIGEILSLLFRQLSFHIAHCLCIFFIIPFSFSTSPITPIRRSELFQWHQRLVGGRNVLDPCKCILRKGLRCRVQLQIQHSFNRSTFQFPPFNARRH